MSDKVGKIERFCLFCHQVGVMVTFENGNKLRKHVKTKHPRTSSDVARTRTKLNQYRKEVLMRQSRLGMNQKSGKR